MTIPSDATGTYGIRFEAFDAAGNKYAWLSNGSPTIVTQPVYLGGRSFSTTSESIGRVKAGDTFTCDVGNWVNLKPNLSPTCLWTNQETGEQYQGPVFTVSQALVDSTRSKTLGLAIRIIDKNTNTVVSGYIQGPGGLETYIIGTFKVWNLDGPR
jgi:hypothetical protein